MKNKKAMYSKIEEAPNYAENLRSILGFKAGVFHVLTKENSGIVDWKDIKGKKFFLDLLQVLQALVRKVL